MSKYTKKDSYVSTCCDWTYCVDKNNRVLMYLELRYISCESKIIRLSNDDGHVRQRPLKRKNAHAHWFLTSSYLLRPNSTNML
jgi:hypothetical protein